MQAINAELPTTDGVACFNRMYLTVTEAVRGRITDHFFGGVDFMTALDIVFGNLYLNALRAFVNDQRQLPRAWAPLFRRRQSPGIAGIQFAVAGLNAHINRDLPVAIVETCKQLGTAPSTRPHHDDYVKVNALLAALEPDIRLSFEDGILDDVDRGLGRVDNVVSHWSIAEARNAAWTNAVVLWSLRRAGRVQRAYLDTLDGTVGMAGRGLLLPVI
jgi:hypothetical protein